MLLRLLILLISILNIHGRHFNGGTITWAPINPYDNSSSVDISITQSYAWSYPTITCADNVPISTSGRSTENTNLTCVVDCSTDGGYSTKPIDILTNCTSVSSSLGILTSEKSHNISLNASAHFYLAYVGDAWVALNYPTESGLEWSIVTFIDLRLRPDGFINTPPVASVVSPQYAIVNETIQINIPVSDVNAGDDVRCRWSTYTPGYRRRRRSVEEEHLNHQSAVHFYKGIVEENRKIIHIRKKRSCGGTCGSTCLAGCSCSCNGCSGDSTCPTGGTCCNSPTSTLGTTTTIATTTIAATTMIATTTTVTTTATTATTTVDTTTIDTPGPLKSTSSYPHRQAIDECGDICYPGSLPNGTTMTNCTISFTGLRADTWYAVAVQVEDFINDTSTTPLSSVPVQFLIYVLPQPKCSIAPIILPLSGCLEIQVGVTMTFNLSAMSFCNPSVSVITDIVVSIGITGMVQSSLKNSTTNTSLSYVTFTWTPLANQVGSQQLCTIAFTSEKVQSNQYCVTFTVKTSSDLCVTTTTTSTSTTTETTTATTLTPTTTTTTLTPTTTTTTLTSTTTTTTLTSTTTTTTLTPTTTTTTLTSTTTTTTLTSATTKTTTTTAETTTATYTTTTSETTTTTSTSSTSTSTTTATASTTVAATTTSTAGDGPSWGLIAGISAAALPLALCCCCCCLYQLLWGPAAKRRRQEEEAEDDKTEWRYGYLNSSTESMIRTTTPDTNKNVQIEVPRTSYQVYPIHLKENTVSSVCPTTDHRGSILKSIYDSTNARRPHQEEDKARHSHLTASAENMVPATPSDPHKNVQIEVPKKPYEVYNILSKENTVNNVCSTTGHRGSILISIYNNTNAKRPHQEEEKDILGHNDQSITTSDTNKKPYPADNMPSKENTNNQGSILISIYNNTNGRRTDSEQIHNTEESIEMGNAWIKPNF